jgi:hypothetical protein
MARRDTYRPFDESLSRDTSAVAAYAAKKGWSIGRRNLLVEGTLDVAYCELASSLFAKRHGLHLVDDQFRVVAAGLFDDGGVGGVVRELITLHGMAVSDQALPKPARVRMLPLFDDDHAGRRCFGKLTDPDFPFRPFHDVFLLKRAYPSLKLGSSGYRDAVKDLNREWLDLDCEIEDLLDRELLDGFCDECPGALKIKPIHRGIAHHYDFNGGCKGDLLKYSRQLADLPEVVGIVRMLQHFRGLFDLPLGPTLGPDGQPV